VTDVCKCVCGIKAAPRGDDKYGWHVSCLSHACAWQTPILNSEDEAVEAWNRVMRPRPAVVIQPLTTGCAQGWFGCGRVTIGATFDGSRAECWLSGDKYTGQNCRAWLIAKLEAAGFDVKESNDAND
jgi:hypothetical protein